MNNTLQEPAPAVPSDKKRALLAERLRRASERQSRQPLSFAQERMWFLHQLEPNSPLYNVPLSVRLKGSLDVNALEKALRKIVERHHSLRTRIDATGDSPAQIVSDHPQFNWRRIEAADEQAAVQLINEDAIKPFDLTANEALIRATLIQIPRNEHVLFLNLHHIAADEWSLKILFRELAELYEAETQRRTAQLPELAIQYGDYSAWQRKRVDGEFLDCHLQFWKEKLADNPPVTELMTDRPRGSVPTFNGAVVERNFDSGLGPRLSKFAGDRNATLFMVLLAGFKALVRRYTGIEDVVVASPSAGRNQMETENLIGFFVNTLLLRTDLKEDPTFDALLQRVRATALGAYEHQDAPFEKVIEALRPERSLRHLAFTNLMFVLQAGTNHRAALSGIAMEWNPVDTGTAKFELTLVVMEHNGNLTAHVEYNSDLFDAATIERLLSHFENLLAAAVANPMLRVSELPLLSASERGQILLEWNDNATEYPRNQCIHELFEEQVQQRPQAVAVAFGEDVVTYSELNAKANRLARCLQRQNIKPGEPVALCVERSVDMAVGMLAILKAGGAYAPLDPRYPKERLAFMLDDTRASVVLTQKHLASRLPRGGAAIICFEDPAIDKESAENLAGKSNSEDLAYIIYTSGSTGRPKGVSVPHRAVNRLVLNTNYISLDATDRIAQVSNISFDAATFEVWGALLNGGQLRGISSDVALSPREFARELRAQGITAMFLTSALFSQLASEMPEAFATMRTLLAGGEALEPKAVRAVQKACPGVRLVNGYGPTENTTFTCCALLQNTPDTATNAPIGRPISNTQVYILDEKFQPVPIGVPGELFTGGDGLAAGYWNRSDLTAEKFITHQFDIDRTAVRLYRTGDLARWLPNGNIEFLGRIDSQVKIRGFRVELGEIEAVLARHSSVRECAVKVNANDPTRLNAYFVPAEKRSLKPNQLRSYLGEQLPDYMIPSAFVQLDSLPLTANGKVDRRALPEPDCGRDAQEKKYAAPRDAVEAELVKIWEEALGVAPIGIEDGFFDLGGHSLLAAKVATRAEKAFGKKVRLATVFTAPTVEKLAALIREEIREGSITAGTSLVELQAKGNKPPLFLVHGAGGGMFWGYVNLSRQLGGDQPVYGFSSRGMDGRPEFSSIEEMAAQYVSDLRKVQPRGPYYLGGYCFGGNVAYEMARQIKAQGEEVAFLALLNCAPPNSSYMRARFTPVWGARFVRNLFYWFDYCRQWTIPQRRDFIKWKGTQFKRWLTRGRKTDTTDLASVEVEELIDLSSIPATERDLWQAHVGALMKFHPQPYAGEIHLFRSPGHPLWCSFEPDYGWGELSGKRVNIKIVSGTHEKILEEPWVENTGAKFKEALAQRQSMLTTLESDSQPLPPDSWNATECEFPRDKTLFQLFEEQVKRTPTAEALVYGEKRVTFEELLHRAREIATHLRARGVGKESLVGVCLERSDDLVASILGTLAAGGAYVPLDPAYPKERLAYIAESAGFKALLTRESLRGVLPPIKSPVLCLENLPSLDQNAAVVTSEAGPTNLAYVLYTSGSTGNPKGVALEHRNAVAFVSWAGGVFKPQEIAGVLFATSMCFDLSIFEMFVPLCLGGKVILADNALALPALPAANEVTLINTVPSAIRELLRIKGVPSSVRVVNLAGEPLATPLVDQIYGETAVQKVYDLYGPTETTTYSTFTLRQSGQPATIGRPLANEQVYVLDEQMRIVPINVPGDLYIGGAGLARGYYNRPDLTAERFVPHPFKNSQRLYKTGDIAKWREDGELIYLGRSDHQVKIRGFRIELGEIEIALKTHPGVADAVVIAREDRPGEKKLVAYIVSQPGREIKIEALRKITKVKLPDYMAPAAYVFLSALPLTPNGKLDRKSLPAPQPDSDEPRAVSELPREGVESEVAAIWNEVLGIAQVGASDDFFELGGHSLLAVQVVSRLRTNLKVESPLSCLYDHRTIRSVATAIESNKWPKNKTSIEPILAVSRHQPIPASFMQEQLWFLHELNPKSDAYHVSTAFRLTGPLDKAALLNALQIIWSRHEALRATLHLENGQLIQRIRSDWPAPIEFIDASNASEAKLFELAQAEARRPFDLTTGPLLRAHVFSASGNDHVLVIAMHHAVTDGWSLDILFRELEKGYRDSQSKLDPLPIQFADFAHWQRSVANGAEARHWKQKLADAPRKIDLPFDAKGQTVAAARKSIELPASLRDEAQKFAQREGGTIFSALITALGVALQKWTRQNDLVIGTVVAGRSRRETEGLIGCFMNFLPLRVLIDENKTALETFRGVKSEVIEAQSHSDYPFNKIVESVVAHRTESENPLYNVALLLQNTPALPDFGDNLKCSPLPVHSDTALLDLRFEANETPSGMQVQCEYKSELFKPATIDVLLASFRDVLEKIVRTPDQKLAALEINDALVDQAEAARKNSAIHKIVIASTFTAEPVAEALRYWLDELQISAEIEFAPFQQVFQQLLDPGSLLATNRRGLNVLLVRPSDWKHSLQTADEFARAIETAAARNGAPILVCICPDANTKNDIEVNVAAALSSMSGVQVATSAQLLSWYPVANYADKSAEELGHIPYTAEFFTALATAIARTFHALHRPVCKVIALDCDQTLWGGVCGEDGPNGIGLDAVRLALQEFMRRQQESGKLLVICSKNEESDVDAVFAQRTDMPLRADHFTAKRVNWRPKSENLKSLAKELNLGLDSFVLIDDNPLECAEVEANCPSALALQLPEDPAEIPRFLEHCWIFDQGQATAEDKNRAETYHREREREQFRARSSDFANFIANLDLRVEITPALPLQLARVAQLTQRTNQFNTTGRRYTEGEIRSLDCPHEILTVTVKDRFGDYGLVGVIIFETQDESVVADSFMLSCRALGRGVEHRMLAELGKIAIGRGAQWVAVPFLRSPRNQPALDFLENIGADFKKTVGEQIVYHFPAQVAAEMEFEPTATVAQPPVNKIQETSSPESNLHKFTQCRTVALNCRNVAELHAKVENRQTIRRSNGGQFTEPRSDIEKQLCDLWQRLLRVDRVGITEDFFELGGHSMLAVRLFAEIEKLTGQRLPLVTLFQAPTIEKLAATLKGEKESAAQSTLTAIQPNGNKPPLYLVHGAGGDILWGYANLVAYMDPDQPIYALKSRGQTSGEEFDHLEDMAAFYLEAIKAHQPEGPYHLGGYCFGGNVAYEIARQLKAQGDEVGLLALLDSMPSNAGYETVRWWRPDFPWLFSRNLWYWLRDFRGIKPEERRRFLQRKMRFCARKIARWFRGEGASTEVDLEEVIDPQQFPERELRLWRIHLRALTEHVQQPYSGHITLFRTAGHPLFSSFATDLCWGQLAADGVAVNLIPGSHENIFMEPHVKSLAASLTAALANSAKKSNKQVAFV